MPCPELGDCWEAVEIAGRCLLRLAKLDSIRAEMSATKAKTGMVSNGKLNA